MRPIATTYPASQESIDACMALSSEPHHDVGHADRSEFTWIVTSRGDLILGIFPYGAGFEEMEVYADKDYERAEAEDTVRGSLPVSSAKVVEAVESLKTTRKLLGS